MKNLDPKIAGTVAVVVILLALFFIARTAGVGTSKDESYGVNPAADLAPPGAPGANAGMGGNNVQ